MRRLLDLPRNISSIELAVLKASKPPSLLELMKWKVAKETVVYDAAPWIRVCRQEVILPNGKLVRDYHKIVLPDFSVMFVETPDGMVLVERQYKHGVGAITLTLPAGILNQGEDPLVGAKRELLEETGFEADHWTSLGQYLQNSNYGGSRAHIFKATNARRVTAPHSGDLEEMEILLMPRADVIAALKENRFQVASFAAAIGLATHPLL